MQSLRLSDYWVSLWTHSAFQIQWRHPTVGLEKNVDNKVSEWNQHSPKNRLLRCSRSAQMFSKKNCNDLFLLFELIKPRTYIFIIWRHTSRHHLKIARQAGWEICSVKIQLTISWYVGILQVKMRIYIMTDDFLSRM